jgi:hypothetical protein
VKRDVMYLLCIWEYGKGVYGVDTQLVSGWPHKKGLFLKVHCMIAAIST